jgi:predicted metal-binding membrane protein
MPPAFFPLFLVVHVVLAVALFVPSLLLPFAFRARRGSLNPERSGPIVRFLLALQERGTVWIGAGLAVSGLALVSTLGFAVLEQPWLLVALVIYAINLGLAYFIQVPRLRSLIGLRSGSDPRWPALARRQRYISYVMAALVGTIGFLMSTKPVLW